MRASTWSSVFIVGAGGPGGFRLPADASPKMTRQATIPIAAAVRATLLTFIADPPWVRCPERLDTDWMWGCPHPYTPVATRDQLRRCSLAGSVLLRSYGVRGRGGCKEDTIMFPSMR